MGYPALALEKRCPLTVGGRIIGGLTMFVGLVLFDILLNVIGKILMVVLFGKKLKNDD